VTLAFTALVLVSVNRVMVSSRRPAGLSAAAADRRSPTMAAMPSTVEPVATPLDEPAPATQEVEV
jgi:hypothetical protein